MFVKFLKEFEPCNVNPAIKEKVFTPSFFMPRKRQRRERIIEFERGASGGWSSFAIGQSPRSKMRNCRLMRATQDSLVVPAINNKKQTARSVFLLSYCRTHKRRELAAGCSKPARVRATCEQSAEDFSLEETKFLKRKSVDTFNANRSRQPVLDLLHAQKTPLLNLSV